MTRDVICGHFDCNQPDTVAHDSWVCRQYDHPCGCGFVFSEHPGRSYALPAIPMPAPPESMTATDTALSIVRAERDTLTAYCTKLRQALVHVSNIAEGTEGGTGYTDRGARVTIERLAKTVLAEVPR